MKKESVTLYHSEREGITIDIKARFENDELVIDGYDIGKVVEEAWGDSDYEYVVTVPATDVPQVYEVMGVGAVTEWSC